MDLVCAMSARSLHIFWPHLGMVNEEHGVMESWRSSLYKLCRAVLSASVVYLAYQKLTKIIVQSIDANWNSSCSVY